MEGMTIVFIVPETKRPTRQTPSKLSKAARPWRLETQIRASPIVLRLLVLRSYLSPL